MKAGQRQGCRRAFGAVVVVVVASLGLVGCFGGGGAEYSFDEGLTMINDGVTAFTAVLQPRPVLPSPSDEGDNGTCNGLDGDSDGQLAIVKNYGLGVVPVATSDAWFDQAQEFWSANGYQVTGSVGGPGELNRSLGARHTGTTLALVLKRVPPNGSVSLIARSPCVAKPASVTPTR